MIRGELVVELPQSVPRPARKPPPGRLRQYAAVLAELREQHVDEVEIVTGD